MTSVTITFEFQSRNNNESLSPGVIVYNASGTVQETGTATHAGNGKYVYNFTTSTSGSYHASFSAENRVASTPLETVSVSTTTTPTATVTGQYVTTLELNEFMNMWDEIPDFQPTKTPVVEQVSSGAVSTTTVFYLDNNKVIDNTLTLSYGASSAVTATRTELTETTDYTVNLDTGRVTLTATGQGASSASTLYAEVYKYNNLGLSDSYIRDILDRAQTKIDRRTNTHFADGSQATPDYVFVTQEYFEGKGEYRHDYFTKKYPIPNVNTQLNGAILTTTTTLTVDSTSGFGTTGTASIETEQFSWTGKTNTTFTGVTRGTNSTTAATHSDDTDIKWLIVEISRDDEGESVTFDTMKPDTEYSMDYKSGRTKIMEKLTVDDSATTGVNLMPIQYVPKRVRVSYPYGYSEIPEDIQEVNLMIAAKELSKSAMRRALTDGNDGFRPSDIVFSDEEIEEIIARYRATKGEYI